MSNTNSIDYPNWIPNTEHCGIDQLIKLNTEEKWQLDLAKRLIEDKRMKEVHEVLTREKKQPTNEIFKMQTKEKNIIGLYTISCIKIFEVVKIEKPITLTKYKALLKKISNAALTIAECTKKIKDAGIEGPSWLNNSLKLISEYNPDFLKQLITKIEFSELDPDKDLPSIGSLFSDDPYLDALTTNDVHLVGLFPECFNLMETLSLLASKETKHPPQYLTGNSWRTRITHNSQGKNFIIKLNTYLTRLFEKPLYEIIAITTNVAFNLKDQYDRNSVSKIINARP